MNISRLNGKIGFIYILLLLPSIMTIDTFSRSDVSHALLGPILMGTGIIIFSNMEIDRTLFTKMIAFGLMPILSLLIITLTNTISEGSFNYISAYLHRIETGGIGPNQVSNILGLGALFSFLLMQVSNGRDKIVVQIVGVTAIIQTMLTHSRGGFWNTILSILVYYFFELTTSKNKVRLLASSLPIVFSFYYLIFPFLDDISDGSVVSRFSDANLTSREVIIESEIIAYKKKPFFGIGPGQSRKFRLEEFGNYKHSHTEYTRLLAEHGIFGIICLIILLTLTLSVIKNKKGFDRSISLTILFWSLLFMIHSATRLAAPCMLFGLAFAKFDLKEKEAS